MKTKSEIVNRLIENKQITSEEAYVLLRDEEPVFEKDTKKVYYKDICGCDECACGIGENLVNKN